MTYLEEIIDLIEKINVNAYKPICISTDRDDN